MPVFRLTNIVTAIALAVALLSVFLLENSRSGVVAEKVTLGVTPATIYQPNGASDTLVIVAHGFAGSQQMMESISLTLARAGHTVVAFDFIGHGRHPAGLSPAIQTLTGTTEDLVRQTLDVVTKAKARTGLTDIAFVGHSMATDVIIRASARQEAPQAVIAISMYSEAVTPTHPERLLVISGASEGRLRDVALDAVSQIGPAQEGETVTAGQITRRAVSAPFVGHVGVLWSPTTLAEVSAWLNTPANPVGTGQWIALLLVAILILFRPLAQLLPTTDMPPQPSLKRVILAACVAALGAGGVATTGLPLLGFAGFGALWLAFGVWGVLVLIILRGLHWPAKPQLFAAVLLVFWGLGAFALGLDRYGAAFWPTGPRVWLAVALLPAALIFGLADRKLVQGRRLLARVLLRIPFLLAFTLAMIIAPAQLGLVFTVLPVLVLYWLVYGTMAMWAAQRTGPIGAGLGAGAILAWSIAASTPLFQA